MSFRFYTNVVSQASRNFAAGLFIAGLLLVGFGFLVYVLRDVFAILAAIVFFVAGSGCAITAVKILWTQRKLDKLASDDSPGCRRNVHVHIEDHQDF